MSLFPIFPTGFFTARTWFSNRGGEWHRPSAQVYISLIYHSDSLGIWTQDQHRRFHRDVRTIDGSWDRSRDRSISGLIWEQAIDHENLEINRSIDRRMYVVRDRTRTCVLAQRALRFDPQSGPFMKDSQIWDIEVWRIQGNSQTVWSHGSSRPVEIGGCYQFLF